MVLMSVRDDESLHLAVILGQVGHIGDHEVNSEHIILGESKSAIYHNNAVPVFERSHIHSDLLQASERNDLQLLIIYFFLIQINPPFPSHLNCRVIIEHLAEHLHERLQFRLIFDRNVGST